MLYKGPDHHRFGDLRGSWNQSPGDTEENYKQLCSQRNEDLFTPHKPCTWMHIAALFENTGNTPKRPSAGEWLNQLCIHIKEYYLTIKRNYWYTKQPEWISRNYAEWKTSLKDCILYDSLHNLWNDKIQLMENRKRLWEVLRRGGSGKEVGVAVTETPEGSL